MEQVEYTPGELESILRQYSDKTIHNSKGVVAKCLKHEERNPSMQVFYDGWCQCFAGCGRFHIKSITKDYTKEKKIMKRPEKKIEPAYKNVNLLSLWESLPDIPDDHQFKTIPTIWLNVLGWKWDEKKNSYFIPYWSSDKKSIPFGQWRHLSGDRRFTFIKDAKPTAYGKWNLKRHNKLLVVEGTSDFVALDLCQIPAIAMPSASSQTIMKQLCEYCDDNGITLVYGGDNDEAGDALKNCMNSFYRELKPPIGYKDWCDFLDATSQIDVWDYCAKEFGYPLFKDDDSTKHILKEYCL